jgi:hypothetical protein
MTTYVPFSPTIDQPFQFNATLDGSPYTVVVTVNFFRLPAPAYYVNLYDASGNLIFAMPLIASPSWQAVPLTTQQGNYIAQLAAPNPYVGPGSVIVSVNATAGTTAGYTAGASLAMSSPAIVTGTDGSAQFSNDIDLLAGYGFVTSTLVYRATTVNFEVGTYPPLPATTVQQVASPTYVPTVGQPTPALPPTSIFPPGLLAPPGYNTFNVSASFDAAGALSTAGPQAIKAVKAALAGAGSLRATDTDV